MKNKFLLGLCGCLLIGGGLASCDLSKKEDPTPSPTEKTLSKLSVTSTTKNYAVGYSFTKNDLNVQAVYSDNSTTSITDYTVSPKRGKNENNKHIIIKKRFIQIN